MSVKTWFEPITARKAVRVFQEEMAGGDDYYVVEMLCRFIDSRNLGPDLMQFVRSQNREG